MILEVPDNPTVDEVIDLLVRDVDTACLLPILDNEERILMEGYRPAIKRRLAEPGRWKAEGPRVRRAALRLGALAAAFAGSHLETKVNRTRLREAAKWVQADCAIGNEQTGQWCQPE